VILQGHRECKRLALSGPAKTQRAEKAEAVSPTRKVRVMTPEQLAEAKAKREPRQSGSLWREIDALRAKRCNGAEEPKP